MHSLTPGISNAACFIKVRQFQGVRLTIASVLPPKDIKHLLYMYRLCAIDFRYFVYISPVTHKLAVFKIIETDIGESRAYKVFEFKSQWKVLFHRPSKCWNYCRCDPGYEES